MKEKTILHLEDNPSLRNDVKDYLYDVGFDVVECKDIYDAKEKWKENKLCIDAIVLDINMPSNGLKDVEKILTLDGVFSGWIWLINYVLVEEDDSFLKKVFLFSDYISNLENYAVGKREYEYEKLDKLRKMKHLIRKGAVKNPIDLLVNTLKKELKM